MNSDVSAILTWAGVIVGGGGVVIAAIVLAKGRKLPGDHVFRASRWSRHNHLFPPQVMITPTSLTLYRPQWIGKLEESIHMAHIASMRIDTHLVFSDIFIETTGGQDPVICHGHTKGDAVKMKQLIEKFQSDLYGRPAPAAVIPTTSASPPNRPPR